MMNANQRSALYAIAAAALPILVFYGLISDTVAPLILALIGAVLAAIPPVVAFQHVTPDPTPVTGDPGRGGYSDDAGA